MAPRFFPNATFPTAIFPNLIIICYVAEKSHFFSSQLPDAFRRVRGPAFAGETEAVEDGALGAHQRRRAQGHHRESPGNGRRLRTLLRPDHRLLGPREGVPAAPLSHQLAGEGAPVGSRRLAGQPQPLVSMPSAQKHIS